MSSFTRIAASSGALLAGIAVALSAVASHALSTRLDQHALQQAWIAIAFLFGHGLGLIVLASHLRSASQRLLRAAIVALLFGILVFFLSVFGKAVFGWSAALAPLAGGTLIVAWLAIATALSKRE